MARKQLEPPPLPVAPERPAPLRIGLTARLLHKVPAEMGFRNKTLQYLEQSLAHWVIAEGALAFMIPTLESESGLRRAAVHVSDYVRAIDGLVLQGGADVSPVSYGEEALRPEWSGDRVRDLYELDLIWECIIQGKPVLGICRGCQLLNVAFGGTLYQDIATQIDGAHIHVDKEAYDTHIHDLELLPDSLLARLYPTMGQAQVNSIHHQSIKDLGNSLTVEARSLGDNVVEAIRWNGSSFVYGVQWHPEFHPPEASHLLDGAALIGEFLREAATRRARG
ncbi:gamma-glutamyl-gamma-aminobutyrate hydrolase family protein [Uliginosibacterium sp. H1]|uniref:gamma-glutamyl-gamma-aminobutyrate hydrolase family protein n=1 Tax=Uliginosibacterium sp. H1 TaxID=3114757 RepID=UPI002E18136A|nr:gamma-glutamyl-gamma-aminobutyrate hydrolase family protein [Uliginosibacterium sp. H1]MEC5397770.1 gamma-glutamyl-gamma-aminobutyrate hydrolase family protein [Uliginosibacterium sp. H1]